MLIITTEHRLVALALAVKDGMPQSRRLDAPTRRGMTVQEIVAELLADRPSVFEGRIDRVI